MNRMFKIMKFINFSVMKEKKVDKANMGVPDLLA